MNEGALEWKGADNAYLWKLGFEETDVTLVILWNVVVATLTSGIAGVNGIEQVTKGD